MTEISLDDLAKLRSLRHHLHELAELSGREEKTAAFLSGVLENYHPNRLLKGLGGHGVAAIFEGKNPGPTLLLRAELDALPIREHLSLDYASKTNGVSHKCGHDGHMAILTGVAGYVAKSGLARGRLVLLFQPAEETGQGARAICEDPQFSDINPDVVFALHNLPGYPENNVIIRDGHFAAASRGMIIRLSGHTAHAGHPEAANSPVLALATLLKDLSALPGLSTSFNTAAHITVVHARLGAVAFGTTPGEAEILATLRSYEPQVMEKLAKDASRLVVETSRAHGLKSEIGWTEIFDPTSNTPEETKVIRTVAQKLSLPVIEKETPFPWSEDFGTFTERYPGALFGLGAGEKTPQLHTAEYDFPDALIPKGVQLFLGITNHYLNLS